ncbi:hypothetical protein KIW84_071637 [Lathyrus oleraceus]|uniref:Uncharacterized protein n=1 Tax=Pisum sativum TaxID=3888 RepID=A0A9D4ZV14_PEA|nr:hypothetical protein KIW84_071637 [Pisum sativum]
MVCPYGTLQELADYGEKWVNCTKGMFRKGVHEICNMPSSGFEEQKSYKNAMEASKKWKLASFHQVDIDTDEISHLDVDTLIGHGGNIKVYRDGSGCEATRESKIFYNMVSRAPDFGGFASA